MIMIVEKLEERWTPTTIYTAFIFCAQSSGSSKSRNISVNLPLLNLGWTFALLLTPQKGLGAGKKKKTRLIKPCNWIPAEFSLRRHGSTIPWGNTSMHAQLSLAVEQHDGGGVPQPYSPCNGVESSSTSLGSMEVALAHTALVEVPLTTARTLSLLQPTKVSLTVSISDCPFANGLFQAVSSQVNGAEAQAQFVRQSDDRLLSRSLVTGKLFDVKFLACSTRPRPGNPGKLLQTHASLSVLEKYVNLSSAKLGEEWTSALAALDCYDNANAKHTGEILCPNDYDYELDSDFEDEDEGSRPSSPSDERNLATLEGQQLDSTTKRSSSLFSSFELDGASDQAEEIIKGLEEPPQLSSAGRERTISVRFAAHRTWYAFLWYCYTGCLEFNKLRSQVEPASSYHRVTYLEDGLPSCSPKSMYRLADLVGNTALKVKALEGIRERMTEVNILDETFSVFTSKYPDVREAQLDILMEHSESPEVKKAFLRAMSKFGSMPHAEPALSAFYDRLAA